MDGWIVHSWFYRVCRFVVADVIAFNGYPPDGKVNVIVDCSLPDLVKVYSGTISATEMGRMCLSGRLYVRRFRFKVPSNGRPACRITADHCCKLDTFPRAARRS